MKGMVRECTQKNVTDAVLITMFKKGKQEALVYTRIPLQHFLKWSLWTVQKGICAQNVWKALKNGLERSDSMTRGRPPPEYAITKQCL